ncbi:MAG: hypothetical protein VB063_14265 [Bacteroides graminisolvens]|nr:hypothetical protein [Bacteroides graminisolvens]
MTRQSICILDDKIPVSKFTDIEADDTSLIDKNLFNHYLKNEEEWDDVDLMNFSKVICENNDKYIISGFTHHEMFFSYIEDNIYSPDIVVFDWDMGDSGTNSEENLLHLLKNTFSLVAVFTSADQDGEVKMIIDKQEFKEYKHNLFLVKKDEDNAFKTLKEAIDEKMKHFSFLKSKELKKNTLHALDSTLANLGTVSFDQFVSLFGHNNGGTKEIYGIDYCEIMMEKIRSALMSKVNENLSTTIVDDIRDANLLRKIWNFRLYNNPHDDIVRKGDIIYNVHNKDGMLYLVISSDCHLKEFWEKNLGYIMLLPLHQIKDNTYISRLLQQIQVKNTKFDSLIASLTSPRDGISVLPGIYNHKEREYSDYLFITKSVFSEFIQLPNGVSPKSPLKYSHFTDYMGDNRTRVSEPFLTPLIQYIVDNITGYGVSDFSNHLRLTIKENLKSLLK